MLQYMNVLWWASLFTEHRVCHISNSQHSKSAAIVKAAHSREHLLNAAWTLKAGRWHCWWIQALFCLCGKTIYFFVLFKSSGEVILFPCISPELSSGAVWSYGLCFVNYDRLEKKHSALFLCRVGERTSLSRTNTQLYNQGHVRISQ